MGKIRIPVVIMIFAISLTLLLLGQHFIFRKHNLSSLEAEFMDISGVKAARVNSGPDGLNVVVGLENTIELKTLHDQTVRLAKQAGIPADRITIQDARGPILSQALYAIHYSVEEGIATGHFQLMAGTVSEELARRDIEDFKIWVEPGFVYLEMHYGPEHLYQVFPRQGLEVVRGSTVEEG